MKNPRSRQKGFTLPEVILIVAALAIVSAMALPDIAYFFGRQTVEQEKLTLANIQKALDSYARECKRLPARENNPSRADCQQPGASGSLPWYDALAAFSNMSATGIQNDVWGTPRVYAHAVQTRNYREGSVDFHYATVRSVGQDRADGFTGARVPDDWPAGVTDWEDVAGYQTFSAEGDDLMVKYTDSQWKVEAQDETVQRMERIIDALDRYAQARFNEEVHADYPCVSEKIFYPPSWPAEPAAHSNPYHPDDGSGGRPDCTNIGGGSGTDIGSGLGYPFIPRYGRAVTEDVIIITGQAYVNTTILDIDTRRQQMQNLMRVLGLPEDHCCSAITGIPFYYYSNPPAPDGTYATNPPYFPPQIRVSPL